MIFEGTVFQWGNGLRAFIYYYYVLFLCRPYRPSIVMLAVSSKYHPDEQVPPSEGCVAVAALTQRLCPAGNHTPATSLRKEYGLVSSSRYGHYLRALLVIDIVGQRKGIYWQRHPCILLSSTRQSLPLCIPGENVVCCSFVDAVFILSNRLLPHFFNIWRETDCTLCG